MVQIAIYSANKISEIETNYNKRIILLESYLFSMSLVSVELIYGCNKKIHPENIVVNFWGVYKEHLKKEFQSELPPIDFEKFVDAKYNLYAKEIQSYLADNSFSFPKTTYNFFCDPLNLESKDFNGIENEYFKNNFMIWIMPLEKSINEWLTKNASKLI